MESVGEDGHDQVLDQDICEDREADNESGKCFRSAKRAGEHGRVFRSFAEWRLKEGIVRLALLSLRSGERLHELRCSMAVFAGHRCV